MVSAGPTIIKLELEQVLVAEASENGLICEYKLNFEKKIYDETLWDYFQARDFNLESGPGAMVDVPPDNNKPAVC